MGHCGLRQKFPAKAGGADSVVRGEQKSSGVCRRAERFRRPVLFEFFAPERRYLLKLLRIMRDPSQINNTAVTAGSSTVPIITSAASIIES